MVTRGTFSIKDNSNLRGFAISLKLAACEWVLLFFLLLDAAFSFFVTKFAQYCELQLPCVICSRLDHVFGKEYFYRNLLCSDHKSEISSLGCCRIHGNLVDVHDMCEECLWSFAMKRVPMQETYKFLVGKLGLDGLDNQLLKDFVPGSLCMKLCSCCSKPWRCTPNMQELSPLLSVGPKVAKPDIPLPRPPVARCLNRQYGLKKRDRFSVSCTPLLLGFSGCDSLSHVGYTEVKTTSDSESDFPFSDDDNASIVFCDQNDVQNEYGDEQSSRFLPKQYDEFFPMKQTYQPMNSGFNLIDSDLEPEIAEKSGCKHFSSDVHIENGLGEITWHSPHENPYHLSLPELISLDDIPLSSNAMEINPIVSLHDRIPNIAQLPTEVPSEEFAGIKENGDIGHIPVINMWEAFDSASRKTGLGIGTNHARKDVVPEPEPNHNGHHNAGELAANSKGLEARMLLAEKHDRKDHDGVDKEVNLGTSEMPTSHFPNLSSSNRSLWVNGHADAIQMTDASSSNESGNQQQHSSSMERSHSYESLDGSCVSEMEGESLVDWLRRQLKHDRMRISSLHKELEEERNACAIAANEAMAMITKLQEEKCALRMEALQYLRMMEEQAEYDVDALDKANNLIAEKEKELQDLEAELEYYRAKYPDELELDHVVNLTSDLIRESMKSEEAGTLNVERIEIENS
ncbi:hypothetical protein Nepgr_032676 [Nepenthes gracilis]|uniref:GTD-binding domain-containing protein n=1 Tax=Nepenthes gracilis TaxID=150966 RepID=A0AAD3TKW7_NEPGR|nr:hypothetical protein Nepgr_032676 [Nepenthes gracilis]